MKRRFTFLVFLFLAFTFNISAQWTSLETDVAGDGSDPSLLDGLAYEYMHDLDSDSLWFRVTVADISTAQSMDIGVNIMVWFPTPAADESLFNFWSPGNNIEWHRLITTWVTGTAPSNYSGTNGISKGADVNNNNFSGFVSDLDFSVNTTDNTIIIGMNRADFIPDDQLGQTVEISAAVGSSMAWNDDIITMQTSPTITLMAPNTTSVNKLFNSENVRVFPNPASTEINIQSDSELTINSLEFYDLTGKLIRSMQTNGDLNIDISGMPAGSYILKTYSEGVFTGGTKLIKMP